MLCIPKVMSILMNYLYVKGTVSFNFFIYLELNGRKSKDKTIHKS